MLQRAANCLSWRHIGVFFLRTMYLRLDLRVPRQARGFTITRYCTQHVALHVYDDRVIDVVELVVLLTAAAADQAWD